MAQNNKSIRELIDGKGEEGYEEFINKVFAEIERMYQEYEFSIARPVKGYGGQLLFKLKGNPILKDLHILTIDKGLDHKKINENIFEQVSNGELFELGEDIEIEEPTGISPVTLGDDVQFMVTFKDLNLEEDSEEDNEEE